MATLQLNKPHFYYGKRDEFTVRTWVYQVKRELKREAPASVKSVARLSI